MRHHWILGNPIEDVAIPSDADAVRMHVLTDAKEEDYFRRAARLPDLHDAGRLIINQGCRPEKITQLAKKDVNLDTNKFFVFGKTRAAKRWLDMTTETRAIQQSRMEGESRWIFPSNRNRGGAHRLAELRTRPDCR